MSGISHRKISTDVFRVKRKSETDGEVIMIPKFDVDFAGYVINNLIYLMVGYLKFFQILFPEGYGVLKQEASIYKQFGESLNWLNVNIQQHKEQYPRSLEWHKEMDKIITLPPKYA